MGLQVTPRFELKVSIGEYTSVDISTYYIYRLPLKNTGGFASITLQMPIQYFQTLEQQIRENNYPEVNVTANISKNRARKSDNLRSEQLSYLDNSRVYYAINSRTAGSPRPDEQTMPVSFYLVDKVLYQMMKEQSCNKMLTDKTAKEAIDFYEGYITERYGPTTFDFKRIGSDYSEYKYDELKISCKSNIDVPNTIINTFKPFKSGLGYYFFDTYRNVGGAERSICAYFVDLSNKDLFQPVDVTENGKEDIVQSATLIKRYPISDIFNEYKKDNMTYSIQFDHGNKHKYHKPKPSEVVQVTQQPSNPQRAYLTEPSEKGRGGDLRITHPNGGSIEEKPKPPGQMVQLCGQENDMNLIKERFEKLGTFYRDTIAGLYEFEFKSIYTESIQFERRYNLDIGDSSKWFVPIGIVNRYQKINLNETTMNCTSNVMFLLYN